MLLWPASMMIMVLATVGTRVAIAMPMDLGANWVFRIAGAPGGAESLTASRRALLLFSVGPVWLATAAACLALWPAWQNAAHLVALALLGLTVADLCLFRFRKLPFTCSWLPGKSHFHMAFLAAVGLLMVGLQAAKEEHDALSKTSSTTWMLASLAILFGAVRLTTSVLTRREEQQLRFEEEMPPAILELGLHATE